MVEPIKKIRLTETSTKAGCAAKFGPGNLSRILAHMKDLENQTTDPNLIVGFKTSDDAGVYRIAPDYALIQTVDFFTPIVDDPYTFGLIAATNALSDVYAMGGQPLSALNICCFSAGLEPAIYADILQGGLDKMQEAGAVLLGGHTVTDNEVKYGLAVTGFVHPEKVVTNAGAKPGDVLILTKPIGTGILSTAFKNNVIDEEEFGEAIQSMSTLNKNASEAMQNVGVHACTDVTGFSLAGHLSEMAIASNVSCRITLSAVPVMKGVLELIEDEWIPGGTVANRNHFEQWVEFEEGISDAQRTMVFDAQTSGGLLISVAKNKADALIAELKTGNVLRTAVIGGVLEKRDSAQYIRFDR